MISYEKDGIVTDDPVVAAMFLTCRIKQPSWDDTDFCALDGVSDDCWLWWNDGMFEAENYPIFIPYPVVWEVIKPVEGEGYVFDHDDYQDSYPLFISPNCPTFSLTPKEHRYHKRILNLITTHAELRELVARCEEVMK